MDVMRSIEIDFEVHQAIEAERRGFDDPPNAALRRLLGLESKELLPPSKVTDPGGGLHWRRKGVALPAGTELKVNYAEVEERGRVAEGKLNFNGKSYDSPSGAVMGVVRRHRGKSVYVNGWNYLFARLPGETKWILLSALRDKAQRSA